MNFWLKNRFHVRKLAAAPKKKNPKSQPTPGGSATRISYRKGSNHIRKGLYVTGIWNYEKWLKLITSSHRWSIPASPRPIRYSHCTTPTPLILWTSWVENFIPNKHRSPRLTSHARFTSHANLPHVEGSSTRRLHTEREWVIRTQPATPTARAQPANLPDPQRRLTWRLRTDWEHGSPRPTSRAHFRWPTSCWGSTDRLARPGCSANMHGFPHKPTSPIQLANY